MRIIPFFLDISFDREDDGFPICPTDPVKAVNLGYFNGEKLVPYTYEADDAGWNSVADWIVSFSKNGLVSPVGWELRSILWPALTMNLARMKLRIPSGMLLPLDKRWNNLEMVDLSNLIMQSGYTDWRPGLKDVHRFFANGADEKKSRLEMTYDIYARYAEMNGSGV